MRAHCAALRPDIQSLAGHGLDASDDFFAAVVPLCSVREKQIAVLQEQPTAHIAALQARPLHRMARDSPGWADSGGASLQGVGDEQSAAFPQLLDALLGSAAPADLATAAAGCVAQRLGLLAERTAQLRYSCPAPIAAAADGPHTAAPAEERWGNAAIPCRAPAEVHDSSYRGAMRQL
jgi:hypothetical protein